MRLKIGRLRFTFYFNLFDHAMISLWTRCCWCSSVGRGSLFQAVAPLFRSKKSIGRGCVWLLLVCVLGRHSLQTLRYHRQAVALFVQNSTAAAAAVEVVLVPFDVTITSEAAKDTEKDPYDETEDPSSLPCLVHPPLLPLTASKTAAQRSTVEDQDKVKLLKQPITADNTNVTSGDSCGGRLRRDWSNPASTLSPLAREIAANQENCSWPVAAFSMDNDYGLGSHLYLWSQAVCNAHERGHRVRTINPTWLWMDQAHCNAEEAAVQSPFLCYFPSMEYHCSAGYSGGDIAKNSNNSNETMVHRGEPIVPPYNVTNPRNAKQRCRRIAHGGDAGLADFRSAAIEYIFRRVSPLVIREAERQMNLIFATTVNNNNNNSNTNGGGIIPDDLITVHIRWGDKFWEMDLAPIEEYVAAVAQLVQRGDRQTQPLTHANAFHNSNNNIDINHTVANIYLSTEDPRAAAEFIKAAPVGWNIYMDRTVVELNEFRPPKGNRASWTSRNTRGRAGLVALGSLLIALEANSFVLTTGSNWSRIIDHLRRRVLDPQCGNCTRVIDLRPGQW